MFYFYNKQFESAQSITTYSNISVRTKTQPSGTRLASVTKYHIQPFVTSVNRFFLYFISIPLLKVHGISIDLTYTNNYCDFCCCLL